MAAACRPSFQLPTVAASANPIVGPSSGAMIIAPMTTAVCPLRIPRPAMIADSVTVLADCAATADVAATLIAGAVDCPNMSGIARRPACEIDPNSDLGNRPVTIAVPPLDPTRIESAQAAGHDLATQMMRGGNIAGAVLELQGEIAVAGLDEPAALLRPGQSFVDISGNRED